MVKTTAREGVKITSDNVQSMIDHIKPTLGDESRAEPTSVSREPKPSEDARPSTQYVVEHRWDDGDLQCISTYEDHALYDHMMKTPHRDIADWHRYNSIHRLHWLPTTGEFVYVTEAAGSGDRWFERADADDVIYFFLFKSMLDTPDDAECEAFFDNIQQHKDKLLRLTHTEEQLRALGVNEENQQ